MHFFRGVNSIFVLFKKVFLVELRSAKVANERAHAWRVPIMVYGGAVFEILIRCLERFVTVLAADCGFGFWNI